MPNIAELIKNHVTLEVDCVNRLYFTGYVPRLQSEGGVIGFLCHLGQKIPSPAVFGQITQAFKTGVRAWAEQNNIPWNEFAKGDRKARRVLAELAAAVTLVSALELLKHWAERSSPAPADLRAAMLAMQSGASYVPAESDPLYEWWRTLVQNEGDP